MRTSSSLLAMEAPAENATHSVDEIIRTLAGLIETISREREAVEPSGYHAEEVLVDTEVDGARYLLVRMRRPGTGRVQLSPREQEIVRMVAKGHPNKVIADVLNISSWTVCTHLRRIFAKLGVGSRAAMVAQLPELGVLASDHRIPFDTSLKPVPR
ncbi:MAG TPA: helix-turn-helix transcriptional regulator [Candidatus Sulfotelmatobacter sp.]|nr:helix-turn-helix transcriptional regulator [Candidatus Sulfotelmatobacter sp.]